MDEHPPGLLEFVRGEADPARFPHAEHVRMAYEMLARHDFTESAYRYSRALQAMLRKIGKPEAFHQTVTIAFLALIAERREDCPKGDFPSFVQANPDVMEPGVLARWYGPERLASAAARRTFLLPYRQA